MFVTETEHKDAGKYAFYAAKDAKMNSAINASRFSDALKLKAERMKLVLEMAYSCDEVLVHNNKTFIKIKVFNGTVRDRKMLAALEADWDKEGIEKGKTKTQAIIYRLFPQ